MRRLITAALAALGLTATDAAVDGTNVWIGATSGGSWADVNNWRAESPTGKTVADLLAGTAVYDLTSLASGAIVTNDYTGGNTVGGSYPAKELVIGGVIADGAADDEWTVAYGTGANPFRFAQPFTADVRGGTLTWRGGTSSTSYPVMKPAKTGAGVFRFAEPTNGGSLRLWEQTMTVNEGTLAFTNQSSATFAFKVAGEGRLLVEGGTARLGSVFTDDNISPVPVAEVNAGAVLDIATSFNTYYPNWSGDFAGSGVIQVSGGGSMQFKDGAKTRPFAFAGTYRASNATATFGALGANPAASAEVASSGWLRFTASQTLARLFGDGVDGGVSVPEGATLTVTGPGEIAGSASFAAADWTGFTGAVCGLGELVLEGTERLPAAASVSANVRFAGITVTADDATATEPFVTTTGRVTVPAAGVLTFAGGTVLPGRAYPIARGGSYDLPADASGWTVSPATGSGKVKFRVRNGVLYAHVTGGMAVIIR